MGLRIPWRLLLVLVLVSVTALSGGYAWLQTAGGKRWLADRIATAVSTPERRLAIGALNGVIPFAPTATGIVFSDDAGQWLTVDRASLRLRPLALLDGDALFETIDVGRVAVLRRPTATNPETEDLSPTSALQSVSWPELPIDLELERLHVAEVALEPPVLGKSARFSIDGAARLGDLGDGLSLVLDLARTDDSPGTLTAQMHYVPNTAQLMTKLRLNEPEGGILARLAALPALPALTIDLSGDGTLDDWRAALTVNGGGDPGLDAMLTIAAEGAVHRVTIEAEGRLAAFADDALRPLVDGETRLYGSVLVTAEDSLIIDQLDLAGGFGAASLTGEIDLVDARSRIDLTADLAIDSTELGLDGLGGLLGPPTHIVASGSATSTGRIAIDSLAIETPGLHLIAEGTAEGWGMDSARFTGILEASDLSRFDQLPIHPLLGAAVVDVLVDWDGTSAALQASAELERLSTGIAATDALLGDDPQVALATSISTNGRLEIEYLELWGAEVALSAYGAAGAAGADVLSIDWRMSLADLAVLHPSFEGSLEKAGCLSGTPDDPVAKLRVTLADGRFAGYPISGVRLDAEITGLAVHPVADIELDGSIAGLPIRAAARLEREDDGAIRIDLVVFELASLVANGSATLEETHTVNGKVSVHVSDLANLEPLVGTMLSGQVDASVLLSQADGRQVVDASVSATGTGLADSVSVERAELVLRLSDALAEPVIATQLQAEGILAGGLKLDQAVVTASGGLSDLRIGADLSGGPFTARSRAGLAFSDGQVRAAIDTLITQFADLEVSVAGPARLVLGADGVLVDGLVIQAEGGRLSADGRYGDTSDLTMTLSGVPLNLMRLVAPDPGLQGRLDGTVRLSGSRAAPRASGDFKATDVTLASSRKLGMAGLDVTAALDWDAERLRLKTSAKGASNALATAEATLSAPVDQASGLPAISGSSHLTGTLTGNAGMESINDILAARGDRVSGTLAVDLTLAGSLATPRIAGRLQLSDASYRNALSGITLDGIRVRLSSDGERLTIAELSAATPNGGSVGGSGGIDIDSDAGFPAQLSLQLDDALIINNDIFSAEVAGGLGITGGLMHALALTGRLTVVEAEIRLPDRLPPSIQILEVEEINVPPELAARRPAPASTLGVSGPPLQIALDLAINAPERIFVRGRGLDAEVAGEVTVRGNAEEPVIGGGFQLRRGFLNALGRRFNFNEGVVTLPQDGSLDADIRFVAQTDLNDVSAQIIVSGRASAPQLTIESSPELPQDEVLARILFGRRVSSLTALESVQLARSAARLTGLGTGPNVLGGVRGALGLDLVDIEQRPGPGIGDPVLNIGGRIRERVTLGVQQGLRAGSGRVGARIELTPNISLDTDVGVNSTGRLGISKEWEY